MAKATAASMQTKVTHLCRTRKTVNKKQDSKLPNLMLRHDFQAKTETFWRRFF